MSALAAAPRWRLVDPPALQIGARESDAAHQFAGIEAVRRLADGRFLVADRGSAKLRIFSADGTHVGSHGGSGDAPGEYRYLTSAGVGPADSLWAFDFGLRRFTVLEGAGAAVRTTAVGTALAAVTGVGPSALNRAAVPPPDPPEPPGPLEPSSPADPPR